MVVAANEIRERLERCTPEMIEPDTDLVETVARMADTCLERRRADTVVHDRDAVAVGER